MEMHVNSTGPWGLPEDNEGPEKNKSRGRPSKSENELDRIIRENTEQLKKIFGGGGGNEPESGQRNRGDFKLLLPFVVLAALFWLYQSFYQIDEGTRGLKMRFGRYVQTLDKGLNFAIWPIYKVEVVDVDRVRGEKIGAEDGESEEFSGHMLTSDENVVEIQFEVQWKIKDAVAYQFNLDGQTETIKALAQSTMREVIAQLQLIPILNTERSNIAVEVKTKLQASLDQYQSGVFVQAVLLTEAVPPKIRSADGKVKDVAAAFRRVQDAEALRIDLQNQAKAEANRILGEANAEAAQLEESAEGYRAAAINTALGEASRFNSVLSEYQRAPEVTRRRLYLETMEEIYGSTDKVMLDGATSDRVVPYLPLGNLMPSGLGTSPTTNEGSK